MGLRLAPGSQVDETNQIHQVPIAEEAVAEIAAAVGAFLDRGALYSGELPNAEVLIVKKHGAHERTLQLIGGQISEDQVHAIGDWL